MTALGLILCANVIDLIPNSSLTPLTWLIACGSVSASTRPPCEAFGGPQDWGPPPPESASTLPFEQWLRETAERIEDSRRRRR